MRLTDIFCSSPASTAVRSSTVHHAGDSSGGGRRSFERRSNRNPNYDDNNKFYVRCMSSSRIPSVPLPRQMSCRSSFDMDPRRKSSAHSGDLRRKSSADASDLRKSKISLGASSPSRYLLKYHKLDSLDDKLLSLDFNDRSKELILPRDLHVTSSSSSSSSSSCSKKGPSSAQSPDQVVVLRVSIHCKGCEGKVRKHISKMEGVTSFSIDVATKKVTVVGNVTPLGVLNSISKVKSAQFWPSSSPSLCHDHDSLVKL